MRSRMKLIAVTASLMAAGLIASAPANAQVHVGIGLPGVHVDVGAPAPAFYYGPGFYPPGPCDAYNYYYQGDCGYAVYTGPIFIDGVAIGGPHYYRWYDGRPYFWYRGDWHVWRDWRRVNFDWDRGEGYGWHGGRWDRDWGEAHWHGDRGRGHDRDDFRDGGDHFRGDRDEHHDHGRGHGDHGDHDR